MVLNIVVSALVYGCATYLSLELVNWLFAQVGRPMKADLKLQSAARSLLPFSSGFIGAMLAAYYAEGSTFLIVGLVCVSLAMATWSELGFGLVPDFVLIVPLIVLLVIAFVERTYGPVEAAFMLALPFAVLTVISKRKQIVRSDIELAAVGGAVLGVKLAVVAFTVALLAAFAVNFRERKTEHVALTPYVSSCIAIALMARLVLPAAPL
jgi:hypothetical protein